MNARKKIKAKEINRSIAYKSQVRTEEQIKVFDSFTLFCPRVGNEGKHYCIRRQIGKNVFKVYVLIELLNVSLVMSSFSFLSNLLLLRRFIFVERIVFLFLVMRESLSNSKKSSIVLSKRGY